MIGRLINRLFIGPRCDAMPKKGELWHFIGSDDKSPWQTDKYTQVKVVDVRDEWVRYDMEFFKDQRMKLDLFCRMYKPEAK